MAFTMTPLLPILYFLVSMFFSMVALNSRPSRRPTLLAVLVLFALLAFHGITDVAQSLEQADVLGLFILIYISHMGCVLLVERHELPGCAGGWKVKSSYKMMFNCRWIGTERQAPDICEHSPSAINGPSQNSERDAKLITCPQKLRKTLFQSRRAAFLRNRLLSALTIYGLNYLYWQLFLTPHPLYYRPLEYSDLIPSKQTYIRRIHDVTGRETIIRSIAVFNFVWSAWALFTGLHDILAFVFVGIGLDKPQDWPPLYGRLDQMYTLRRFWGKFWHRLVYRSYTGCGILLSEKIFRLPSDSGVGRLLINFIVFFLSGIVHALVTWKLGFTCGYWEDIGWFCLNFLGILLEEGIQWVYSKCFNVDGKINTTRKVIGFLWVFGFFFWSLPKTQYPKMFCRPM